MEEFYKKIMYFISQNKNITEEDIPTLLGLIAVIIKDKREDLKMNRENYLEKIGMDAIRYIQELQEAVENPNKYFNDYKIQLDFLEKLFIIADAFYREHLNERGIKY